MEQADTELKRTPLEDEHRSLGAKLGAFAGWLMPIEYEGTLSEHRAVRERVGLFDLTHLGKMDLEGPGSLDVLQRALTNDLRKVEVGQAQYNMLLNERGGIEDDLIAYRLGDDRWFVVPNGANTARVHGAFLDEAGDGGSDVVLHETWAFLAVQGPRSLEVVGALFSEAADLGFMRCLETEFEGDRLVLSRSGYTGERGYELFLPEEHALALWRELTEAGQPFQIEPAGLGARDTLRLEMGYPLHGQDITAERTPLEAGASWAVSFDKGDFRGREALVRQKEEGVPARLWGLVMTDRLIPRAHYPVLVGQEAVGETTSGTFSPTRRQGIALAYLTPRDRFQPGDEVEVDVRGRRGRAEVTKPPFVDSSPR